MSRRRRRAKSGRPSEPRHTSLGVERHAARAEGGGDLDRLGEVGRTLAAVTRAQRYRLVVAQVRSAAIPLQLERPCPRRREPAPG
jgi:hypothetical protein